MSVILLQIQSMTKKLFIPSDRYLLGIEDFGEKIGGARKDLYSRISQNLASGKIDYDKLVKAGTRKDVILLAYYAKFYDVPDEDILSLITNNNDEAVESILERLLFAQKKSGWLKIGRGHSFTRLVISYELWDIFRDNVEVFLKLAQKGIYTGGDDKFYYIFTSRWVAKNSIWHADRDPEDVANMLRNSATRALAEIERKPPKGITGWDKVKQELCLSIWRNKNIGYALIVAQKRGARPQYLGSSCIPILFVENVTNDTYKELVKVAWDANDDRYKELRDRAVKIIDQLPPYSNDVIISYCLIRGANYAIGYRTSDGEWYRLDNIDAFSTISQSLKFLCDNFVDVYTRVYNIVHKGKEPYEPYHENVGSCAYRKGPDWRNGRNATENDFLKVFGFRGVEFGNYVTQKERQPLMNKAYDALRDMCNILELEPRIVGLGGRLGLAFGARGKGGKGAPAAHYEPFYNVINLTRPHGAGSLAHEWFHALDHNFVINKELFPDNYLNNWNGKNARYFTSLWPEDFKIDDILKPLDGVVFVRPDDPWYIRSKMLQDGTGKKQNGIGYWTQPTEVGARCFEAYVRYKLHEQGWQNDFLSCFHYAHIHFPYPIFFDEEGVKADAPEALSRLEDNFVRLLNPDTLSKVLGEKFTSVPVTTATAASTIETTDNSPATTLTDTPKEEQEGDEQPKDDDEEEEETPSSEPDEEDATTQAARRKEEMHKFLNEFVIRFQKTKWTKNE